MPAENFRQLMDEDEEYYLRTHNQKVRSGIWGTLGLFRLVGDLVHMFIPQVINVFVLAAGGQDDEPPAGPDNYAAAVPPSEGPAPDPGKVGPTPPDGDNDNRYQ